MNHPEKRILITGGCGFIGSNFIHYLSKHYSHYFVLNVDNLSFAANPANLDGLNKKLTYHFLQADITDQIFMHQILKKYHIDTIINFAAESHVDRSITDPGIFVRSNVFGTYALLEAARTYWLAEKKLKEDACLFYHISTDEVYGSLNATDPAFTEKSPYRPNSPYSATKASADHLVRAYAHTYGLPTLVSNCSNNYGPRQHDEKFIPTIIHSCLSHTPIPVYGNGTNIRDWLFVEDHCRAIHLLIEKGRRGEMYNIGGNQEKNNLDVVEAVCTLLDELKPSQQGSYKNLIHFVTDRAGHDWRYAIDAKKIQQLGWLPQEDFGSGLRKTVQFYTEDTM